VLVLQCGSAGWCGILMQVEALVHHPAETHRNTNTHRITAIQHMK